MSKSHSPRKPRVTVGLTALALAAFCAACGPGGGSGTTSTYAITFTLSAAPAPVDELSFDVEYRGGGGFDGQGTDVQCERLAAAVGATSAFDDDDLGTLTVDMTAGDTAMSAVTNILRCMFSADTQPSTANFTVTVTKALDEGGEDIAARTQVLVTSITQDTGGGDHFLTFRVTSAHSNVGSLQFEVEFFGDQGAFAASGQNADCTDLIANSLQAATVADGILKIATISTAGFDTPTDVARCRFVADAAPVADDFDITLDEATTVSGDPIDPDVAVASITGASPQ